MIGLLVLSTAAAVPLTTTSALPCDGVRTIEATTAEKPRPFASLRVQAKEMITIRNGAGRPEQREVDVTNVRALAGFTNCRFIYSAQIDLACYIGTTFAESETDTIAAKLISTAESVGQCLTNTNLVRSESEVGSTPAIIFGGGPRQPFWQISMVTMRADPSRVQPEVLVLGPAPLEAPARPARSKAKSKRKAR